jgi:hypothetical protein
MPPKKPAAKESSWWRIPELQVLLAIIRELKPCGAYEWDKVAASYNLTRPEGAAERNAESCKNKFKGLKNSTKPTGTADCPWEIKEAKAIQRELEARQCTMDTDALFLAEQGADAGVTEPEGSTCVEQQQGEVDNLLSESGSDDEGEIQEQESQGKHRSSSASEGSSQTPKSTPVKMTASQIAAVLPQRLGASQQTVQAAATIKRARLDKQIEEQQQRNAQASQDRSQLITLLLQQQQAQQIQQAQQAAQQQQMNMMMMALMGKVFGVSMPPAPSTNPPSNTHNDDATLQ